MLARGGATVVTGGLGGVMRAASRGARGADGETIGILPGTDPAEANEYVKVAIATGLGVVRNLVVVTSADAVVAVGGRHGTLSEIGLALRMGRHVVTLSSWRLESDQRFGGPRVHRAKDPRDAAALALRLAKEGPSAACVGRPRWPFDDGATEPLSTSPFCAVCGVPKNWSGSYGHVQDAVAADRELPCEDLDRRDVVGRARTVAHDLHERACGA